MTSDGKAVSQYMRKLGSQGGQSRSKKKVEAVRQNLAKARETLAKRRLMLEPNSDTQWTLNGGRK